MEQAEICIVNKLKNKASLGAKNNYDLTYYK